MGKYYFTSESVTEGHPDKVADLISDSILDGYLEKDPFSRVAIETFLSKNLIVVAGEVTSKAEIDVKKIIKEVLEKVDYLDENLNMDYNACDIKINISKQSPDIAQGVDVGGAGDQGIMFGYATDETKEFMPYPISMAHKLAKRLTDVRKNGIMPYLKSDGKVQVSVEYEDDIPKRIDTILISTQHDENVDLNNIKIKLIEEVINKTVDNNMMDENTKIFINPTGRFVIGGPAADTGLTGRKIIVDTYGGMARHGGGAFSGKDGTKVDRSAAYMLRHIAKNVVANGYAKKCELQMSYGIGINKPLSLYINCFGTNTIAENEIINKIESTFDLTPNGIINYLELRKPIYSKTTNYGHFGREGFNWEKIIKL